MKLFKEPFLHFILIGAVFFVLFNQSNQTAPETDSDQVFISSGRIEQIAYIFEKTWQRKPTQPELEGLVHDFVLEEIYVRKAREIGIDSNDAIIRRRLRQKFEFLTEDFSAMQKPSDQDLETYLSEHPEKFMSNATYSFDQVYINPKRHGADIDTHLATTLTKLQAGETVHGDSAMMPRDYKLADATQLRNSFGMGFAEQLKELPTQQWIGPIESGLGQHFIFIREVNSGALPHWSEIRRKLETEWQHNQRTQLREELKQQFIEEFTIEIEWPDETQSS